MAQIAAYDLEFSIRREFTPYVVEKVVGKVSIAILLHVYY